MREPDRPKSTAETYLRQARTPDHPEHWSGPAEMVDGVADVIAVGPAHRVLDVGCGVGGPARRLASRCGCRVTAVDPLVPVLGEARRRTPPDADLRPTAADATALPFVARSFDRAICLGVVAHIVDRRTFTSEVFRVLDGGGRLAVTEAFWDGVAPPRFLASAPRPWQPVTTDALCDDLASAGFEDVQALPWPGREGFRIEDVRDPKLRADLVEERLITGFVTASKPR